MKFQDLSAGPLLPPAVVVVAWSCAPALETNAIVASKANVNPQSSSVSYLNPRDFVQYSFINYCYILEAIDF